MSVGVAISQARPSDIPAEEAGAHRRSRPSFLTLEAIRYSYGGPRPVLDGFSLSVRRGEFVVVLGPSGGGKSTLLKLVAGIVKPQQGQIRLGGEAITGPRRDVGMVFQKPTLLPWRNVRDNVLLPARFSRAPEQHARADSLLDLVGLREAAGAYPHQLSGGMAQRVGLARMLLHDPALLLLDEPFAALDAMSRELLALELQSIVTGSGKTALFVTHSIPEAVLLADRVIVLAEKPARIVADVPVPIARPRTIETMASAEFNAIAHDLRVTFQRHAAAGGRSGAAS